MADTFNNVPDSSGDDFDLTKNSYEVWQLVKEVFTERKEDYVVDDGKNIFGSDRIVSPQIEDIIAFNIKNSSDEVVIAVLSRLAEQYYDLNQGILDGLCYRISGKLVVRYELLEESNRANLKDRLSEEIRILYKDKFLNQTIALYDSISSRLTAIKDDLENSSLELSEENSSDLKTEELRLNYLEFKLRLIIECVNPYKI